MTMHIEARVKLAEKMGWKWDDSVRSREGYPSDWPIWIKPDGDKWFTPSDMPDPSTDPAADYAVLGWMRETELEGAQEALEELCCHTPAGYRLGNYARTACMIYGINYDTGET